MHPTTPLTPVLVPTSAPHGRMRWRKPGTHACRCVRGGAASHLAHGHGAEVVDVKDALGVGDDVVANRAASAETRVVDQHVDAPRRLQHLLDRRVDAVLAGDVQLQQRAAELGEQQRDGLHLNARVAALGRAVRKRNERDGLRRVAAERARDETPTPRRRALDAKKAARTPRQGAFTARIPRGLRILINRSFTGTHPAFAAIARGSQDGPAIDVAW